MSQFKKMSLRQKFVKETLFITSLQPTSLTCSSSASVIFSVGVTTSTTSTGVVVLGSGMMTVTLVGVVVVLKSISGNGSVRKQGSICEYLTWDVTDSVFTENGHFLKLSLIPVVADLLVGGPVVFPSLGTSETVYVVFGFKPGITISVGRSVIGISCRNKKKFNK